MTVYIKIEKNGFLVGYLNFPDEDTMADNMIFFDDMFDAGYILTRTTKEEYDSFEGGDELSVEDIKNGNYQIDDSIE